MMIKYNSILLLLFCISKICFSQNTKPTVEILKGASIEGEKEGKNIIVIFTASWCSNCHLLKERIIEDSLLQKPFSQNYVIRYITVLESDENRKKFNNPGGFELLKKYKGEEAGLPFFVILDHKGELLADSFIDSERKKNIGRPYTYSEVQYFVKILKETSSLSETELSEIAQKCNPKLFSNIKIAK